MEKFNFTELLSDIKKEFKDKSFHRKIGLGSDLKVLTEKDYIRLPDWWYKSTNTYGIAFGRITFIAGCSDSGKTAFAIEAMKAAQAQGVGIIYCETENKTTAKDLQCWGVDPDQVILIQARLAEEAFTLTSTAWDKFKERYPNVPLLVIIDSLGNVISQRDSEIDMINESQKPGGKGSINRLGLNRIVSQMEQDNTAVILVSYTYDNMGSQGKTNAGGQALNLFSSLTYQTSRKGWLEKTEKGQKVRVGAEVVWTLYKNHLNKESPGAKKIVFAITKEGMSLREQSDEE